MLYSEIVVVCSEVYTTCLNTNCGQNEEFLEVIPSGTYNNLLTYLLHGAESFLIS
jgi:hypothetical protein